MNKNGSGPTTDFLDKYLSEPDASVQAALRDTFNAWRRKRVYDSLLTRPVVLPLNFTLPLAGQVSPIRDTTPSLGYDVVITGARTNCWPGNGRDINFMLTDGTGNFVRNNNISDLFLRTDDLAGCTVDAGGGQIGVFPWPQPYLLKKDYRLVMEMFKTDVTAADEIVTVALIGHKVIPQAFVNVTITPDEREKIDRALALRLTPETKTMKIQLDFPLAAVGSQVANIDSPRVEEPILLRGMRTSMRNSTVEIAIEGEATWMSEQVPIWSLAAENDLGTDNYIWFHKPLYLPSDKVVSIRRAINGNIDQSNIDPAAGNEITIIYDTV